MVGSAVATMVWSSAASSIPSMSPASISRKSGTPLSRARQRRLRLLRGDCHADAPSVSAALERADGGRGGARPKGSLTIFPHPAAT